MRFMLLVYLEPTAMNDAERERCFVDSARLANELHAEGRYLGANPLQPTSTAACVRVRNGKAMTTDGPFMETREHLGGYYLVEAKDRDEALAIAARVPAAKFGTVEVRPLLEIPGLPD